MLFVRADFADQRLFFLEQEWVVASL
jgi:hypothetical protein